MNKKRIYYKLILRNYILPVLGFLLGLYIKLVIKTSKVDIITDPEAASYIDNRQAAIFAFWHGRLLMVCGLNPDKYQMHVLVSKNEIGILADHCMRQFRIQFIRGSSHNPQKPDQDKGGREAFKEILKALRKGHPVGITPDGPLGPAQKVNKGVIAASMLSQKPIIPLTYGAKRGYYAKSWDKFLVPYPFGTLVFKIGKPITVPKDADKAEYARKLENALNQDLSFIDNKLK